jgi:hypothetical protein
MNRIFSRIPLIVGVLLLFSSCEFQSYKDYNYPDYDGNFEWTQEVKNAEWANRYGHAAVLYDNRIWVMGGYNPGVLKGDTYYEDVWSSEDGVTWELVLEKAPWLGRKGHRVVVFNDGSGDAMFLVGGFTVNEETGYREYANDVWKSEDGLNWLQVKPNTHPEYRSDEDWFPRFNHVLVAARHGGVDYMYIIGGASMLDDHPAQYAMKYFNDVWRSTDGVSWEKLNNNDFGIRSEAAAAVDPNTGRIFKQGGVHGVIFEEADSINHPRDDWHWLWSSDDGVTWVPENDTAMLDQSLLWRSDHKMLFYDDALWVLPGKTVSNVHYHFTYDDHYVIWKREGDGLYEEDSYGIEIDPRHGYDAVVMEGKLFILGGFTSTHGQANDVWSGILK